MEEGSKSRVFSPHLSNTLQITGPNSEGTSVYSPKENLIIACPKAAKTVHFYDTTNPETMSLKRMLKLDSPAVQMSHCPRTDSYLFGCSNGEIYYYDATLNEPEKLLSSRKILICIQAIAFINSSYFAFSASCRDPVFENQKKYQYIWDRKTGNRFRFSSKKLRVKSLETLSNGRVLLASLRHGQVVLYRTNFLPDVKIICSVRIQTSLGLAMKEAGVIKKIVVKNKEFIITSYPGEKTMKIWHLNKGRMKLLKVIQVGEDVSQMIYLENEKMIAVSFKKSMGFFSLWTGELRKILSLNDMEEVGDIFLMNEKGCVGVVDSQKNIIQKVVLLDSCEGEDRSKNEGEK